MKLFLTVLLVVLLFSSVASAQSSQITIYKYDPGDTLHPFKLASFVIRPPIALVNIFVKGAYWTVDSEPIRRAFNIEYSPTLYIDEDY